MISIKTSKLVLVILSMLAICLVAYFVLNKLMLDTVLMVEEETQYAIDSLIKSAEGADKVELSKAVNIIELVGTADYLVVTSTPLIYLVIFLVVCLFVTCIHYEIKLKKSPNKRFNGTNKA